MEINGRKLPRSGSRGLAFRASNFQDLSDRGAPRQKVYWTVGQGRGGASLVSLSTLKLWPRVGHILRVPRIVRWLVVAEWAGGRPGSLLSSTRPPRPGPGEYPGNYYWTYENPGPETDFNEHGWFSAGARLHALIDLGNRVFVTLGATSSAGESAADSYYVIDAARECYGSVYDPSINAFGAAAAGHYYPAAFGTASALDLLGLLVPPLGETEYFGTDVLNIVVYARLGVADGSDQDPSGLADGYARFFRHATWFFHDTAPPRSDANPGYDPASPNYHVDPLIGSPTLNEHLLVEAEAFNDGPVLGNFDVALPIFSSANSTTQPQNFRPYTNRFADLLTATSASLEALAEAGEGYGLHFGGAIDHREADASPFVALIRSHFGLED